MFDELFKNLALPGTVEGRYLLLLKIIDLAETLGGTMMKEDQLTTENMAAITKLKADLAMNFATEMTEVTSEWLEAIEGIKKKLANEPEEDSAE